MATKTKTGVLCSGVADVFAPANEAGNAAPIHFLAKGAPLEEIAGLSPSQISWLKTNAFDGTAKAQVVLPNEDGAVSCAVLGIGDGARGDPSGPSSLLIGKSARGLPAGTYRLPDDGAFDIDDTAIAWGLGAYRFGAYKSESSDAEGEADCDAKPRLVLTGDMNADAVRNTVEAIWFGRDLINTPASDMGPEELEQAARTLAKVHGARIACTVGEDLLEANLPMIHAVGRASPRAPRLIDLRWQKKDGREDAPRVTLVGKGICFDTGGLDLKPAAGMVLMKKDMGGAAATLAVAHMIMGQGLDVRLRVLIPAAENSVSGNAFRPSDVLTSRSGKTVEVGNTDAEGRLVLADALTLASEEQPDTLVSMATLTGAARVALGPDLPAFFCDDDEFAHEMAAACGPIGDPVWRMPFWPGYDSKLKSDVADMNNISGGPFAGAITAALFLKRFVSSARRYAHIDLFGWRPQACPIGPLGGETQSARALFAVLARDYA